MGRRMLFLYNPKAGKGQIRAKLADVLDIFAAGDYEIHIVPTQRQGDAVEIVRDRPEGYDVVVCSGGDGTLDETVTGMMQSGQRTPIGYIPAGSTNDYGSSLALPKDMLKAARIIVDGRDYAVDIGAFNDNVFVYVAAFGAFTEVSYATDQNMKNLLGHSAYLIEGAKSIPKIRPIPMKITHDGEVLEDRFIYGMITNSRSVGGFKGITGGEVDLGDGVFEVMLVREPASLLDFDITRLFHGHSPASDLVVRFESGDLLLESEEEVAWTLDGENGGAHRIVRIVNRKQAIDIRVAESEEE